MAARRPRVIGVALLAVHNRESVDGACLKVHHLEVCLRMPDGEGAVVGDRVEQITAVGTDAGMADGLFFILLWHSNMLNEGVDRSAEGGCGFIEGDSDESVL